MKNKKNDSLISLCLGFFLKIVILFILLIHPLNLSADHIYWSMVYDVRNSVTGQETLVIYYYGDTGAIYGYEPGTGNRVKIRIPLPESIQIAGKKYTFTFPPIAPGKPKKTLILRDVIFEDKIIVKDISLFTGGGTIDFRLNKNKTAECPEVKLKEEDMLGESDPCCIAYEKQSEKVFGTFDQQVAYRGLKGIHLYKYLGEPMEWENLAISVPYCHCIIDLECNKRYGEIPQEDPITWAVKNRKVEILENLFKMGADPNEDIVARGNPLWDAIQSRDTKAAEILINAGVDINHNEPLAYSIRKKIPGITGLIIKTPGINNKNGQRAYESAIEMKDLTTLKLLISRKIKYKNPSGFLKLAVNSKNIAIIKLILGAFPDKKVLNPALATAVDYEMPEVVKILLQSGAGPNSPDSFGEPVIISAAANGNREIVALLLKAGADADKKDKKGWTALSAAIQGEWQAKSDKYLKTALLLIRSGADVNCTHPISGEAPLMWAAAKGSKGLILDLLSRGANLFAKSKRGNTAIVYARSRGRKEIVKLLREKMASKKGKGPQ